MVKWLNGYWTTPNFSSLHTLVHFRHLMLVKLVELVELVELGLDIQHPASSNQ